MTLKEQVLAGKCVRQTDSEALAQINHYLTDGFILAALRKARAGDAHDGYHGASIGLTTCEARVFAEQMGRDGPIRHRVMVELPSEGIAASHGNTLSFSLMGDPTVPRSPRA